MIPASRRCDIRVVHAFGVGNTTHSRYVTVFATAIPPGVGREIRGAAGGHLFIDLPALVDRLLPEPPKRSVSVGLDLASARKRSSPFR